MRVGAVREKRSKVSGMASKSNEENYFIKEVVMKTFKSCSSRVVNKRKGKNYF